MFNILTLLLGVNTRTSGVCSSNFALIFYSKKFHTVSHLFTAHLTAVYFVMSAVIVPMSLKSLIEDEYGGTCWVVGPLIIFTLNFSLLMMVNIAVSDYVGIFKGQEVSKLFASFPNT